MVLNEIDNSTNISGGSLVLKSLDDVAYFMKQQRIASFASVDTEGKPHVVPVWFTYHDGKVFVQTDRNSLKVRNLKKNKNVAIAVYSAEEAVIIRGEGQVIEDEEEFIKRTRQHINKYNLKLDEQGRDSMKIPLYNSRVRCMVEITPKKIVFW